MTCASCDLTLNECLGHCERCGFPLGMDDTNYCRSCAWRVEHERALAAFRAELEKPILAILRWLDRQLRRSPRLHRWLSR